MAEAISDGNEWGDLQEQQTEIEALQGNLTDSNFVDKPVSHPHCILP